MGRLSPVHRRRRAEFDVERERRLALRLPTPTWALHTLAEEDEGSYTGRGWLAMGGARNESASVTINGDPVQNLIIDDPQVAAPTLDPTVAIGADVASFTFRVDRSIVDRSTWNRPGEFALLDGSEKLPELSYFFPGWTGGVLPPPENRMRVSGNTDVANYLLEGFSAFTVLSRAYRHFTGGSLTRCGVLADWGVGCGRVARYFEPHVGDDLKVVGLDIDDINIEWCRQHAPWMTALRLATAPPAPLPDRSVDVIIGVSVMTHLPPQDEDNWLREIHRLLTPGGVAMLTSLGDANFARSGLSLEVYRELDASGVLDVGRNDGIDGADIADKNYYRNVFHTSAHVQQKWTRNGLALIGRLPAAVGHHQDLNVLRKYKPGT